MMPVYFGPRRKERYKKTCREDGATHTNTLEINTQYYTDRAGEPNGAASTAQLFFNDSCDVDPTTFQLFQPTDEEVWKDPNNVGAILDSQLPGLCEHFKNIKNSKKTVLYLRDHSFPHQYGFTAEIQPTSQLDNFRRTIEEIELTSNYRLTLREVTFYTGPKGEERWNQAPTEEHHSEYTNTNISVKFSLAQGQQIPTAHFFNDEEPYPLVDIIYNMHVGKKKSKEVINNDQAKHRLDQIIQQVTDKTDHFKEFIKQHIKQLSGLLITHQKKPMLDFGVKESMEAKMKEIGGTFQGVSLFKRTTRKAKKNTLVENTLGESDLVKRIKLDTGDKDIIFKINSPAIDKAQIKTLTDHMETLIKRFAQSVQTCINGVNTWTIISVKTNWPQQESCKSRHVLCPISDTIPLSSLDARSTQISAQPMSNKSSTSRQDNRKNTYECFTSDNEGDTDSCSTSSQDNSNDVSGDETNKSFSPHQNYQNNPFYLSDEEGDEDSDGYRIF